MSTAVTTEKHTVYLAIRRVVSAVLDIAENEISLESRYIEDLAADSIKSAQIVFSLEEEFGLDIDEGEIAKLRSVDDTVSYICSRLND